MKLRILTLAVWLTASVVVALPGQAMEVQGLSEKHQQYGKYLYELLTKEDGGYKGWQQSKVHFDFGPQAGESAKSYVNSVAASLDDFPRKSCVVTEHYADGGLTGLTIRFNVGDLNGKPYDPRNNNWYWAHFLPDGTIVAASPQKNPFAKPGFVTIEDDGRLWVFKVGSKDLVKFAAEGEPAKISIRPGAGPGGMSLKSSDQETIIEYLAGKPGFVTIAGDENRVWIFKQGSDALKTFLKHGEPAKLAAWPAAGPMGMTIQSADTETLADYVVSKPGFFTKVDDGRIWVFKEGSDQLKQFLEEGEPAKMAIRPAAGPRGMTVKGPDQDTLLAYLLTTDGFHVSIDDGRIWVFREGSEALKQFKKEGEPEKIVIRPAAGPLGMTVKGPDNETVDAYLRAFPQPPTPVSLDSPAGDAGAKTESPATTRAKPKKADDTEKSVQAKFGKKGFFVKLDDGRLWVYQSGSDALKQFQEDGEPAKMSILPGAGPGGITLKGPNRETLLAYIAAKDGFATFTSGGRVWVFREGSKALESFKKDGEPEKIVIRPGAGPNGATLKGANNETLNAYLKK